MIRLLIADDEPIVIDSIRFIVEKYIDDVEVVGSARSGKEAIEKALQLKPDVLFMDIHMPGINGIEAIRHIQESNRDIIFVIITAYEYFQYAREAVKLGVSEYLLKPINKKSIINTLQEAGAVIRARRERIKKETALMEQIGKILPRMEGQFIYSQLFKSNVIEDIAFYEEIFEMKLMNGYVMVAILDNPGAMTREEILINSLEKQKLYQNFTMALKNAFPCLIGLPLLDRIVAFIPESDSTDAYEARNRAIEIAKAVMGKTGNHYRIGIGRKYNLEHFSESYQEACMAATCIGGDRITHFEDVRLYEPEPEPYPYARQEMLLHKFMLGDLQGTLELFEDLYAWLSSNYRNDHHRIKTKLIELFILTRRAVPAGENDFLHQLLKAGNIFELKIDCVNYLKRTMQELQEYRKKELNGLILEATQYIEENYRNNITLDDVARQVNMSYHYFSKFFRDSTGRNFTDYLTDLRMQKAKQFLKQTGMNIKAVSCEIGYSDPNYFSKIFKKYTGLTPTEYRRNAVSKEVI